MAILKPLQISLTGGAKSGKTTLMKLIADYLGIYALSTGDMFRCHAYVWINSKLPEWDVNGRLNEIKNAYIFFGKKYNYFYKQKKITELIDTFEMSSITCQLAQNPEFRKIVKDKIAKIISKHKQIIVEGRDTGTKILPNAQIKVFLEHDYDSRARNVVGEDKEFLLKILKWRDSMDESRAIDPFVKPKDAIVFNNSYVKKKIAAELLLQNVIIPKLNELKISTNNYTANASDSKITKDAKKSSKKIKVEKVHTTKKTTSSSHKTSTAASAKVLATNVGSEKANLFAQYNKFKANLPTKIQINGGLKLNNESSTQPQEENNTPVEKEII